MEAATPLVQPSAALAGDQPTLVANTAATPSQPLAATAVPAAATSPTAPVAIGVSGVPATSVPSASQPWFPALLEPAVKAVTLVGTASFLLSCAYDWAFFRVAHTSFAELPTTVADHARSALNWLPTLTMAGGGIAVFRLLLSEIAFNVLGILLFVGLLLLTRMSGGAGVPFSGSPLDWTLSSWLTLFPILWLPLTLAAIHRVAKGPSLRRGAGLALLTLMLLPCALAFMASLGATHAEALLRDADSPRGSWQTLERGEGKPALRVTVLRSFEKAVLAWDPAARAPVLVPWSEIKTILYHNGSSPGSAAAPIPTKPGSP